MYLRIIYLCIFWIKKCFNCPCLFEGRIQEFPRHVATSQETVRYPASGRGNETVTPEVSTQPRFSTIPLNGGDDTELLLLITRLLRNCLSLEKWSHDGRRILTIISACPTVDIRYSYYMKHLVMLSVWKLPLSAFCDGSFCVTLT